MSMYKKCKVLSIIFAIISLILYSCITFETIGYLEYEVLLFLLYFGEAFLALTIIFIVLTLLLRKVKITELKSKMIAIISASAITLLSVGFSVYGYITFYDLYTPDDFIENNTEYIQKLHPYLDLDSKDNMKTDLEVSHIPGTDFIKLYSYSWGSVDYTIEYFESISPFMNFKYRLSRSIPTPFNDMDVPVIAPGKRITVNGVDVTVFENESKYAVLITSFNKNCFAVLENISSSGISSEDFAREVINQMELLEEATDNKTFLDVPISERNGLFYGVKKCFG